MHYKAWLFATYALTIIYAAFLVSIPALTLLSPIAAINIIVLPFTLGSFLIIAGVLPRPRARKDAAVPIVSDDLDSNLAVVLGAIGIDDRVEARLLFDFNAAAYSSKGKGVVAIGYPLLVVFDEYELAAVLCHEIAHHLHDDVSTIRAAARIEEIYTRILRSLRGQLGTAIGGPYRFLAKKLFVAMKEDSRRREFEADRVSAELIGGAVGGSALRKTGAYEDLWKRYLSSWLGRAAEYGIRCDVFELFRSFAALNAAGISEWTLRSERSGGYDTHPSLDERYERLAAMSAENRLAGRLRAIRLDGKKYSESFWDSVGGDGGGACHSSTRDCFAALYAAIRSKYAGILEGVTYGGVRNIRSTYPSISYDLYRLTGVSDAEAGKWMAFDAITAGVYADRPGHPWIIGRDFTPALEIGGGAVSLMQALASLYDRQEGPWNEIAAALGVQDDELICKAEKK
jgi:Zn-dependent protease with chaperone function